MRRVLVIISAWLICFSTIAQKRVVDSLTSILQSTPDHRKIDIYQEIVVRLWLNHPDSALTYARDARELAEQLDDDRARAIATRMYGGSYYYKGQYDSAIKYSHKAYAYSEAVKDSALMTSAMNNIGLAYYNISNFPEALEYLLRALNLKIRIKQQYGMSQTLTNIGLIYEELGEHETARSYFRQGHTLALQQEDFDQVLYALNNLGFTFLDENNFDSATFYFNKALILTETVDNVNWHAATLSGLAQVAYKTDDLSESRKLFRKSLSLRQYISDVAGVSEIYAFYGGIFTKEGSPDSARFYLQKALSLAKGINAKDYIIFSYDLLKDLAVSRKQYDSALYFQSQFIALRDSIYNDNLARNIKGIQILMEREAAESKLAAKDNQIRKITVQRYVLGILIVLLFVFTFFLYHSNKAQRRLSGDLAATNKEITLQKEEIHAQRDKLALSHKELESAKEIIIQKNIELSKLNWQLQNTVERRTEELEKANRELQVVNLELDNFIYRSSHDIRGPLVRLMGICHVALLDVNDAQAKEYFHMLADASQQLNDIFDRLKTVSHINDTAIEPKRILVDALIDQVLEKLKAMEGFEEIEVVRETLVKEWYTDPFLLELVMLNMIENAIRFQKRAEKGKKFVKIRTAINGKFIKMSIIDNGIGINKSSGEDLYQMFSKAARDQRNIGLGLYIVKQCVGKLNGSINLVENPDGYTEFEVMHPILV